MLVDKIHGEYDTVIIQFGIHISGKLNAYDALTGVQSLVSRLNTEELVALLAGCDLLVAIDSGPVHIAGAVGTPVVGLYGALDPRCFLPPDSPAVGVFSEVPCLFCHHKTPLGHWKSGCPNDIRCMVELDVEKVFQAAKAMLAKLGSKTRCETGEKTSAFLD
jgi:ADP-heptose:LPS heptosyltransferase